MTRATWPGDLGEPAAEAEARRLVGTARSNGSHVLFTTYAAGTTPVGGHFSWIPTYLNDAMIDWHPQHERRSSPTAGRPRSSVSPAMATSTLR